MYSYTLYINPLHELITFEIPDFFKGVNFMIIESSMIGSLEEAIESLEALIKEKQSCLKLKREIYVMRESNPVYMMSEDSFKEQYEKNEDFQLYVDSWDETAIQRVTVTSEELNLDDEGNLIELPEDEDQYLMRGVIEYIEEVHDVKYIHEAPALIQ